MAFCEHCHYSYARHSACVSRQRYSPESYLLTASLLLPAVSHFLFVCHETCILVWSSDDWTGQVRSITSSTSTAPACLPASNRSSISPLRTCFSPSLLHSTLTPLKFINSKNTPCSLGDCASTQCFSLIQKSAHISP